MRLNLSFALVLITSSAINQESYDARRVAELRVKAIRGWDKLLTWAFGAKIQPYPLATPPESRQFQVNHRELLSFEERYGYFSVYHPIVGVVTRDQADIDIAQNGLNSIHAFIEDPIQRAFASDEFLGKVMAYRTLKKGREITIGADVYVVDRVIDLWHGMPAFGLVPKQPSSAPPILLFRGTDLTLTKERGWASILSDLDVSGPGYRTFRKARPQIEEWLKMQSQPARLVGFSLGGAFVIYTLVDMPHLVSHTFPSTAICIPGAAQEIVEKWEKFSATERPPHFIYLNQGDLVSQIGIFFSPGYAVAIDEPMQVIEAHVTLMGIQPRTTQHLLGTFVIDRR